MTDSHDLMLEKAGLSSLIQDGKYRDAFSAVGRLLKRFPGSTDLLVLQARLVQLLPDEHPGDPSLEQVASMLEVAHVSSESAINPLIELGHFEHAVLDNSALGLQRFQSAERLAWEGLEQALIGQAKCLADLGRIVDAKAIVARLKGLFPDEVAGPIFDLELVLSTEPGYE